MASERGELQQRVSEQAAILEASKRYVKPGGRLVYVTCSLYADENFSQVKQFLGGNPTFRVEAPDKLWNNHLQARDGVENCLVLQPHKDGTDGFYAAVLLNDAAAVT